MSTGTRSLLEVINLKLYYPSEYGQLWAVDDVCLEINRDEVVGIVGESGCGKSTLARAILGLNPTAKIVDGKIIFQGSDLLKLSPKEMQDIRGGRISMVFQNPTTFLNPVMKIKDQLMEILLRHNPSLTKKEARSKISQTLRKVHLHAGVLENYPFELSGGMLQRTMIVMMLLPGPRIILADEPTSALDTTVQAQVLDLLKDLQKNESISLLIVTHDLAVVAEICDRVYVMYAGRIVESADVHSLYETPMHPYTTGLLGSTLSVDEYKESLPMLSGEVPDLTNRPHGCVFNPRCQYSMDVCRRESPPISTFGKKHKVNCWLYR